MEEKSGESRPTNPMISRGKMGHGSLWHMSDGPLTPAGGSSASICQSSALGSRQFLTQNKLTSVSHLLDSQGRQQVTFSFSVLPGPRTMSDRVGQPCLTPCCLSLESLSLSGTSQAGSGLCQEASVSSWAPKGTTSSTSNQPRRETAFQPHPLLSSGYGHSLTTLLHPSRL